VWPLLSAISKRIRGRQPPAARNAIVPEPTIDGIADALRACRSDKEFQKLHRWSASNLTPLEAAALIEFSHRLPPQSRDWLSRIAALGDFASRPPQPYCRQPIAANIDIYRDPFVASERKSLILGFGGAAAQLMFPTPALLQYLPSDRYDLVLLRDRTKQGYARGVPPYAHSLLELAQRLAADVGAENYRRVYCYGTSMGGFPALRCGILLKAETAISGGGQFPWYPNYLKQKQDLDIAAFDPLCDCNVNTATTLICCYGSAYKIDADSVDILAGILPVQRIPIASSSHGFFDDLREQGRVQDFFDRLFDAESDQVPAEQSAKTEPVA
jgi:hypothetical protein